MGHGTPCLVLKLKFFKFLCALYTSGPSQHSQPEPLQPNLSAVFRSLPAGASLAAVLAVPSVSKAVCWLGHAQGTVPFCHASCQCPAAFPPLPGEVCHTGPRHHAWFPRWPGWQQPTSVKVCRVRAVHHSYGWMQTVTLSWPLPKPDGLGFNGAASQSA